MKEIKDDKNRVIYHGLGLEESILWKWLYYPKQSTVSTQSLSNYQWHFFYRAGTKTFTTVWKHKRSQIAKAILRKKNGTRGINLPDFRLSYKATGINTVWSWQKSRNIDQWNKMKAWRYIHTPMGILSLIKEARIHNGERQPLQWVVLGKLYSYM